MSTRTMMATLAGLLVLAIVGGVVWNVRLMGELRQAQTERDELRTKNEELASNVRELEGRLQQAGQPETVEVTVYYVASRDNEFVLVPEQRPVPRGRDEKLAALTELVQGPRDTEGAQVVIPTSTRVLSLTMDNGTAVADFSDDITRMNVGALVEALVVASIVNTLTEFADVQRVQLLVDGERVETLAGHVDVSGPLERDDGVVRRS